MGTLTVVLRKLSFRINVPSLENIAVHTGTCQKIELQIVANMILFLGQGFIPGTNAILGN